MLGCQVKEVIFTSGGTESNNLAILGARSRAGHARHVVSSEIGIRRCWNACQQLEREGVAVTYVGVSSAGVVDPDDVRAALLPETVLISVMHVNNEIGTIQPLDDIAAIARGGRPVPFRRRPGGRKTAAQRGDSRRRPLLDQRA
jgi:cysteine desulfurase